MIQWDSFLIGVVFGAVGMSLAILWPRKHSDPWDRRTK